MRKFLDFQTEPKQSTIAHVHTHTRAHLQKYTLRTVTILCQCVCASLCSKTWRKMLWKLILLFVLTFCLQKCKLQLRFLDNLWMTANCWALIESDTESAVVYQRPTPRSHWASTTPTLYTPSPPRRGKLTIDFHIVGTAMQTENLRCWCCWRNVVVAIDGASCRCLQCRCRPVIVASPASAEKRDSYSCKSTCTYVGMCVYGCVNAHACKRWSTDIDMFLQL